MDRKTVLTALAAIITTIDEIGEAPAGIVYAGLMGHGISHGDYTHLQTMLVSSGIATIDGSHVLRLTDSGRAAAAKINASIAA